MRNVTIQEPIRVLAAFGGGRVEPLRFKWQHRTYRVDRINAHWLQRDTDSPTWHFSVQVDDQTYYLHLRTHDLQWQLDQLQVP